MGCDDPLDAMERVRALEAMRQEPEFLALAGSFKRVLNIVSRAGAVARELRVEVRSPEVSGIRQKILNTET